MKRGYKTTNVGAIPEDWCVRMLSEVSSMKSGESITASSINQHGPYPCYGGNGLRGYTSSFTHEGDFALIGRQGALCGNVNSASGRFFASEHAVVVTPRSGTDIHFLTHLLRELRLNRLSEASAQPGLSVSKILQLSIPLPSDISEQRAISQALSDVDALLTALDRLIAKKRAIKQATMQLLLTGTTRLPGFSGKWEKKRLGDMADIIKGNTLSKSLVSESGINPCILYGELFTTYGRVITKTVSFTNSPEGIKSLSGDVLLPGSTTTTGADLATASALLLDGVALGGDINVVRQKGIGYDPAFLACYLTHVARNEIAELAQGTTIHHLYGKDLKGLSLSLPHHTEQSAIASVISDMDAELTALEARREKTRAIKQGMMQELLTGKTRLI
jgi:type I restriction enzyme S subunit